MNKSALGSIPPRFWQQQCYALIITAICLWWLWGDGKWDFASIMPYFQHGRFVYHDQWWLAVFSHHWLKDGLIVGLLGLIVWVWQQAPSPLRRERLAAVGAMILAPLVVSFLKNRSVHACPWDLREFGGHLRYVPLWHTAPLGQALGRCFPSGHASAGFAAWGGYFLWWRSHPRWARLWWYAVLLLGLLMGWGQVMRGAHFFSHVAWAAWWSWATCCVWMWWHTTTTQPVLRNNDVTPFTR